MPKAQLKLLANDASMSIVCFCILSIKAEGAFAFENDHSPRRKIGLMWRTKGINKYPFPYKKQTMPWACIKKQDLKLCMKMRMNILCFVACDTCLFLGFTLWSMSTWIQEQWRSNLLSFLWSSSVNIFFWQDFSFDHVILFPKDVKMMRKRLGVFLIFIGLLFLIKPSFDFETIMLGLNYILAHDWPIAFIFVGLLLVWPQKGSPHKRKRVWDTCGYLLLL